MTQPDSSEKPRLTEEAGCEALHGHLVDKALAARAKYGPKIDHNAILAILADREVVRYPTCLRYDAAPLQTGEFAFAQPIGKQAADGYFLCVHPHFRDRPDALPLLVAYHLVSINYGPIATHEEAELFGATLLGMEVDAYYEKLCNLVDGMSAATT